MPKPVEEQSCSRLSFIAYTGTAEPIRIDQLRRAREPVSRSKRGVQGKVADVFHGRSRHAESQNELHAFRILLATARSDAWQEQPFVMHYHHEGKKHRYTPDILVGWAEHQEVVEVKDDAEAELPENRARFELIGGLLAAHGYHFRVWKRSEISAEPRLSNANLVLRYRSVAVSPPERERVRRVFSSAPEFRLGGLAETSQAPVQAVLRLVLEGTLHLDWWKPLGLDSRVSNAPIGPQIWPVPPLAVSPTSFQENRCR
jgi:hypothetical protein